MDIYNGSTHINNAAQGNFEINAYTAGISFGSGTGGSGGPIPDGNYRIINKNSGLAIDVPNASSDDSVQLQQFTINNSTIGIVAQTWHFAIQSDGTYVITNRNTGKAVDVRGAGKNDEVPIQQYTPNSGVAQAWVITTQNGGYVLTNKNSGKVIDVPGGSSSAGVKLIQYTLNGGNNQVWIFSAVSP